MLYASSLYIVFNYKLVDALNMAYPTFLCPKVHHWPAITSVWFVFSFIVSYCISTSNKHVERFIPYISDTGGIPPESCILGQMMNIGSIFSAITMYIRYRQIKLVAADHELYSIKKWNNIAFWLGNISSFGISIVGNFQKPALVVMHFAGAFMAFGIGLIYFIVQTKMSFTLNRVYNKHPEYGIGPGLLYFRIFVTVCYFILFFVVIICGIIAFRISKGDHHYWNTEDAEGYQLRLIAAFGEWLMFLTFTMYTLTGTKEFKLISFEDIGFKSNINK